MSTYYQSQNVFDLIETLWNVKIGMCKDLAGSVTRFNRDIVECKGFFVSCSVPRTLRFNRDIVECKEPVWKCGNVETN